jgi:hypothetical protein
MPSHNCCQCNLWQSCVFVSREGGAEAVAVLITPPAHNLKECGLTALAAITR